MLSCFVFIYYLLFVIMAMRIMMDDDDDDVSKMSVTMTVGVVSCLPYAC